jgi:spermidine synthase
MTNAATRPRPYVVEDEHTVWHFDERAVQSAMWKRAPYDLVLVPFRVMMWSVLLCERLSHVGIVGLGGGEQAKWCWRYLPTTKVAVAEIDEDVIALARREFHVPSESDRFQVRHEDGAHFVAARHGQFDLLIVDAADGGGVPDALGNDAFYRSCWESLRDGGVAVFNLEAGPKAGWRVDAIARRFGGLCWVAVSPFNGQAIVFAQRAGAHWAAPQGAVMAERAAVLGRVGDLGFEEAIRLFASTEREGVLLVHGRWWRCSRLLFG